MTAFVRALLFALLLVTGAASAQPASPAPPRVDDVLADSRKKMDRLQQRMAASPTLETLATMRVEAGALQASNAALADELAPQVANVEARLAELGDAPPGKGDEAADLTKRRDSLAEQRASLDAQLRLARLIAIESAQVGEQIDGLRRMRFEAQIGERTPSVLAKPFWVELRESWAHDWPLLKALAADVVVTARSTPAWLWAVVLVAIGAMFTGLRFAHRLLMHLASTRVPHGRIRRSLLAIARVLIDTAAMLVATSAVYWTFVADHEVKPAVDSLLRGLVTSITFGAFVAALGRALMAPTRPSWRVPPLPDLLAMRLRHDPLWLGLVIAVGWSLERLAALVNAALATTVAINCLFSLALSVILVTTMRRGESVRRTLAAGDDREQAPPRPLWHLATVVVTACVLLASVVCLLVGYVALGNLLVKQLVWVLVVATSAYLLAVFVEDACVAWLAASSVRADDDDTEQAAQPALRTQAAVLLSAAVRIMIVAVAAALMLGPLGQGPVELMQRTDQLREGIAIGEMRILPGAVFQALVVLAVGIFAVRAAKKWLLDRYLPTTTLDSGMRISTATLLGYVGFVFAVALSLSALGLGLERVAWVASALSVGIGFGLQAVVQNFVSGLILLTERPVKVGDWVALGGVEGDIRRINVRATEVQMGDRSTVIVPNSEFITKVVRNVTHANPMGLVQLKLPMPLDTDAEEVRNLLLAAFAANADVVDQPPPNVQLDGIEGGNLLFSATASVGSPRQVGGVKSALLFDILARLRAAGLALGPPVVGLPVPADPPPLPVVATVRVAAPAQGPM